MLIVRPAKARRNPSFRTRMNPGQHHQIHPRSAQRLDGRPLRLLVQFGAELAGRTKRAGICRSRARARMPASATSLNTSATSAGTVPARQASATATKFEPLPEPSTPMRKLRSFVTRFSYRHRGRS